MHLKQKEVAGWMIPPVDLIVVAKKRFSIQTFFLQPLMPQFRNS
jgi:hypothetical protein